MTNTGEDVRTNDAAPRNVLARHPLIWFFVLAYAFSWIVEAPVVLSKTGTGLLPYELPRLVTTILIAAATFTGPTVAAFVMAHATEGPDGVRRLARRYVHWRVGIGWYLFVLLAVPVIEILGAIVIPGVVGSYQPFTAAMAAAYPLNLLMTFVLGGPLGEEPGWRGFALPRLQRLRGPLLGTLVLGVLWALWHLPLFWSGVWTPPTPANIVMFIVMITGLTVMMTWVFNHVQGSLLITMLMHATFNTFANKVLVPLFPAPILEEYGLLPMLIAFCGTAIVLALATRGRLGYDRYLATVDADGSPLRTSRPSRRP